MHALTNRYSEVGRRPEAMRLTERVGRPPAAEIVINRFYLL
jgi:hypothetical protein